MSRVLRGVGGVVALSMLGFALMGCAVGPDYHPPQLPAPSAFAAAPSASIMAVDFAQWWRVLDDPLLDRLVEQAVRANPDLDIAVIHRAERRST